MPSKKAIVPQYIKWADKEFWADADVRTMDFMSRHFYRALCIAAHYCSTRPYLPSDDDQLWKLADAGTKELWMKHKDEVLSKFMLKKGSAQLAHKRILADWATTDEWYKQQKEKAVKGGKAKAAKSAHGQPTGTTEPAKTFPLQKTETEITETETRLNQITEHEHQTETETRMWGSGSGDGGLGSGEKPDRDSGSAVGLDQEKINPKTGHDDLARFLDEAPNGITDPYDVVDVWRDVFPKLACYEDGFIEEPTDCLEQITKLGQAAEMLAVINWLPKSNYWGGTGKGALKGLKGFLNAWPAIRQACSSWHEAKRTTMEEKARRRGK